MADYPRNDLLVETGWLAEHLTDPERTRHRDGA